MIARQAFVSALVSILVGLVVLRWEWLASLVGMQIQINRGEGMLTFEYAVGFPATFLLGYIFPTYSISCAIWFMLGPTVVTHSIYIYQHGIPSMWPVELVFLVLLTLPYVGLAWCGGYLRNRFKK